MYLSYAFFILSQHWFPVSTGLDTPEPPFLEARHPSPLSHAEGTPGTPQLLPRTLMSLKEDGMTRHKPAHLVVQGTDVQRCVSRGILRTHIGAVEEEVLQMLDVSVSARL